jgi:hypothetical protein
MQRRQPTMTPDREQALPFNSAIRTPQSAFQIPHSAI